MTGRTGEVDVTVALFANDRDGRICCAAHAGSYFAAEHARTPMGRRWATPLGTWFRWTAEDDAAWLAEMGEPAGCEVCRSNARQERAS